MLTSNGVNIQSLTGKSGIQFDKKWLTKFKIKNYPITGYYAQLGNCQNEMIDRAGNLLPDWLHLMPLYVNTTSPFRINTFITSTIHRISFKFNYDRSSVIPANGNSYDLILLYAFDDFGIHADGTRLNAIISSLNPSKFDENSPEVMLLSQLRSQYLCGAIKFDRNIKFSDINTIIDLSSYVIPQCSFKCLTEPGLNNVDHYTSDNLKLNNFYDENVDSNQFVSKETAQYYINSKLNSETPIDLTFRIRKSGLIEY